MSFNESKILPFSSEVSSSGVLQINGHSVDDLVEKFGSPLYIYDEDTIRKMCSNFNESFQKFYKNSPFIIVLPIEGIPATQHVRGSNFCHIGVISDHNRDRSVVISVLDNLIKGSAGQAIQNANIIFDFDETTGLLESPIFPWNE